MANRNVDALAHRSATSSSLGLLRIVLFSTWTAYILADPLHLLGYLPIDTFSAPGVLRVLPDSIWHVVLSEMGLMVVRLLTLSFVLLGLCGLLPHRSVAIGAAGALVLYQGILRGFAGHINHAELLLLYATGIVAAFPCFDAFSMRKATASLRSQNIYAVPFVVIGVLFCITYSFVGIVRLMKGPDLFLSETFRNLVLSHWIGMGGISGEHFVAPSVRVWILDAAPQLLVKASYVAGTVLELFAPVALFSTRFRYLFVSFVPVFHVLSAVALGVVFFENIVLLVVFSQVWFHQAASRAARAVTAMRSLWFVAHQTPNRPIHPASVPIGRRVDR
jgi:fluoride ion exporter CrcB/FEX